jgi:hypothetical protein
MKKIKIYGLKNSGTNFLKRSIKNGSSSVYIFPGTISEKTYQRIKKIRVFSHYTEDIIYAVNWRKFIGWKHSVPRNTWVEKKPKRTFLGNSKKSRPMVYINV